MTEKEIYEKIDKLIKIRQKIDKKIKQLQTELRKVQLESAWKA